MVLYAFEMQHFCYVNLDLNKKHFYKVNFENKNLNEINMAKSFENLN